MSILSKYKVLTQARDNFTRAEYKLALENFARVLQNYPNSKEAFNGVILSEMAMSGEGGAEALFDYYAVLKEEDSESADLIMEEILQNLDGSLDKLSEIFAEPLAQRVELEDGILYQDFKNIVNEGADFKETFENIMFSTRVLITKKEDFLDFLENLIEHGFQEMALTYLDSALTIYPSDAILLKLFEKLSQR